VSLRLINIDTKEISLQIVLVFQLAFGVLKMIDLSDSFVVCHLVSQGFHRSTKKTKSDLSAVGGLKSPHVEALFSISEGFSDISVKFSRYKLKRY